MSKYVEWLLTCPVMQYQMVRPSTGQAVLLTSQPLRNLSCLRASARQVVLAGTKVNPRRKFEAPMVTACMLLSGMTASLMANRIVKMAFFMMGVGFLVWLITVINGLIMEHTDGRESLLQGRGYYRIVVCTLVTSWFPFPLFWSASETVRQPDMHCTTHADTTIRTHSVSLSFCLPAYLRVCLSAYVSDSGWCLLMGLLSREGAASDLH